MDSFENQVKEATVPSNEIEMTQQPTSTTKYLSVEISNLMPFITDDLSNSEDAIYLNVALQHAKESKDFKRKGDYV